MASGAYSLSFTSLSTISDANKVALQLLVPRLRISTMVELRKRKAPAPAPAPPAKKKNSGKGAASKAAKAKTAVSEKVEAVKEAITGTGGANGTAKATTDAPAVDDIVDLATFGGEIETNDGKKTTLQKLVEESKAGVVLFTYPRASTPGCKSAISH